MSAAFWETDERDAVQPDPARIRWRVISRIAKAGTKGLKRKALRNDAGSRYRQAFLDELGPLKREHVIEDIGDALGNDTGCYRLTPWAVRLIRVLNPAMVAGFPVLPPKEQFWEPPEAYPRYAMTAPGSFTIADDAGVRTAPPEFWE